VGQLQVEVCRQEEWDQALWLLFSHLPASDQAESTRTLMHDAAAGTVDLSGLLLCRSGNRVLGAMLTMTTAGRTMLLWPPRSTELLTASLGREVHLSLMHKMRWLARRQHVRLVQALLEDADRDLAPLYLANGFTKLTRLVYLQRKLDARPIAAPLPAVDFVSYADDLRLDFLDVMARSYIGSLDCPEMNGVRLPDEVFESHKAQGEFNPKRWLLAKTAGAWVGCLFLAGLNNLNALEVAYVGVVPEFRSRGLGRELVRQALREGIAASVDFITLAVDARNAPARHVYRQEGFETWDERDAYVWVIERANSEQ
jgi:ribosomal protein S18 acetylase RimI-like enzyme